MPELEATSDLVVGQWAESPRLRAAIDAPLDTIAEEVFPAFDQLALMRHIDTATGVWLDYLGHKVGLNRPATTDPAQDERFGFDEAGEPFNQAPFEGNAPSEAVFPLPDEAFRVLVRARATLVLGDGTVATYAKALRYIDPAAAVLDRRDMTIRVVTAQPRLLQIAENAGALPRTAGVRVEYEDLNRFGFDGAGVGFDQGPFRGGGS